MKTETGIIKISRVLALITFVIGTLILLLFYLTKFLVFAPLGFYYLIVAAIINSVFLIGLISKLIQRNTNKKQAIISILILLANIPVAIIYYNLANVILGNMSFE